MSEEKPLQITLRAARVNAGLTQKDVAKKLRLNKQTLVNWENGLSEPKLSQARKLCGLYGLSIDNIFLPKQSN